MEVFKSGNGRGNDDTRGKGRGFKGSCSWSNGSCPQCQLYGKLVHTMWQCCQRFEQDFPNPQRTAINPPPPPSIAFHNLAIPTIHNPKAYLATPAALTDTAWYSNSGTSHHNNFEQRNMITGSEYEGFELVYVGNGKFILAGLCYTKICLIPLLSFTIYYMYLL